MLPNPSFWDVFLLLENVLGSLRKDISLYYWDWLDKLWPLYLDLTVNDLDVFLAFHLFAIIIIVLANY